MYEWNTKYDLKGGNSDRWVIVSDSEAERLLDSLVSHAKEKGFDIKSYMEFVNESVLRKV